MCIFFSQWKDFDPNEFLVYDNFKHMKIKIKIELITVFQGRGWDRQVIIIILSFFSKPDKDKCKSMEGQLPFLPQLVDVHV